jgi:hypothetical protein
MRLAKRQIFCNTRQSLFSPLSGWLLNQVWFFLALVQSALLVVRQFDGQKAWFAAVASTCADVACWTKNGGYV